LIQQIVEVAREISRIHHFSGSRPRMHPSEELYSILGLFEGEIDIYEKETEKDVEKFLEIKRMSNQEFLEDEMLLTRERVKKQGVEW
jgi:hypothetical protein